MRILLHDIICSCCVEKGSGRLKEGSFSRQAVVSTLTIDVLAKDVCASIPQWTDHELVSRNSKEYSTSHQLQCYTVLWPLYVAGKYATSITKIRPWVVSQYLSMSTDLGIRNANVIGDILETASNTNPWSVYATLGSYAFAA